MYTCIYQCGNSTNYMKRDMSIVCNVWPEKAFVVLASSQEDLDQDEFHPLMLSYLQTYQLTWEVLQISSSKNIDPPNQRFSK